MPRIIHLLAQLLALSVAVVYAQTYIVRNNCPRPIDLFIGEASEGTLNRGQRVVKTGLGPDAGFFYTTTNGGKTSSGQLVATRAGFYFEPNYWYYYLVRDQDQAINTGISIKPNHPASSGFCTVAACEKSGCDTAYTFPPVFHSPVPPPADGPAPSPPLYQCKEPRTNFTITFCPSGRWPKKL
ncbi:hypothetical protein DFP72DRAFT_886779 [Ephemerocybe angulata]|uniref:Osmotin, thaumatin-like protein n=1 Tax=Ephemerocybe angulata TaxID=980116 RepID=A0A8H6MBA6_9AGAR|nr:hypothetical protein DFP72DRAFT_886779 [Tulosesus angulatus]